MAFLDGHVFLFSVGNVFFYSSLSVILMAGFGGGGLLPPWQNVLPGGNIYLLSTYRPAPRQSLQRSPAGALSSSPSMSSKWAAKYPSAAPWSPSRT